MWVLANKLEKRPKPTCALPTWDEPYPFSMEARSMATKRSRRRRTQPQTPPSMGKPSGVLHPRVQQVGPRHSCIVSFDCPTASSKLVLADFCARPPLAPAVAAPARPDLAGARAQTRRVFEQAHLRDGLVAIERTGGYHRLVQRACAAAGFETRILHPFVT